LGYIIAFKLLALEYFKNWQANINPAKIDIKRQLDTVILVNNSQEWQDKAYQQWKTTQNQQVFIYSGEKLPYKTTFLEQEIYSDTEGLKIKEGNKIYVCQSQLHDIKNHLKEYVSADELIKLYQIDNDSSLLVQTLQSKISQLEEVITNLLSGSNNNSKWENSDTWFDDFGGVITEKEYNLVTGYKAEAYVYEELKKSSLCTNVVWTNQAQNELNSNGKISVLGKEYFITEKYEPYDLTFTDIAGNTCFVQVKATTTSLDRADDVKMIITKNEWRFLQDDKHKNYYYISRVFSTRDNPSMKFFKLELKMG